MNENNVNESNVKLYSVLAYIGLLWIIGVLVKEKDNKTVKFHVGQGIILTILGFAISVVYRIVNCFVSIGFSTFGYAKIYAPFLSLFILLAMYSVVFILMIIGIINAARGEEKELPIIGQYAFYK